MYIMSLVIEFFLQSLLSLKKNLVGDLTIQDIFSFARKRNLPENLTQILWYAQEKQITSLSADGSYSFIANYGLFGQLLGINAAVVIGIPERPQDLKALVNKTDESENGRAPYRIGNITTGGVPVLASRGGHDGLQAHKYLAQVLPSMEFVIATAVRFTQEAFDRRIVESYSDYQEYIKYARIEAKANFVTKEEQQAYFERKSEQLKEMYKQMQYDISLDYLVTRIMAYVLVGVDIKEEHYELIRRMERLEPGVTHDYRKFVEEAISHQKINPLTQCALWKALNQQHAQPGDPLIHDLFTVLVTNTNVSIVVSGALVDRDLVTALISEIKVTPQDADKRKTLRYDKLKQMFELSLSRNNFQPASLPRYLEKPLEWADQTIPGGTKLFIQHRSLDTETKHSAFSFGYRSCPGQRLAEYIFRGITATGVERRFINSSDMFDVSSDIASFLFENTRAC